MSRPLSFLISIGLLSAGCGGPTSDTYDANQSTDRFVAMAQAGLIDYSSEGDINSAAGRDSVLRMFNRIGPECEMNEWLIPTLWHKAPVRIDDLLELDTMGTLMLANQVAQCTDIDTDRYVNKFEDDGFDGPNIRQLIQDLDAIADTGAR